MFFMNENKFSSYSLMEFALDLCETRADKELCDRLVKSYGIDYSQFGSIANLMKKREIGLIGRNDFSENVERQVLNIDCGTLKRIRFDPNYKKIYLRDAPACPFTSFPCINFKRWAELPHSFAVLDVQPSTARAISEAVDAAGVTWRPENVVKVLRWDDPIRVQKIADEPFYNLIFLEKDGTLYCHNREENLEISSKLYYGRFKGDIEWNIYGEDFYVFIETTGNQGHTLLLYDFYPFRCKYKMTIPVDQNVRHISLCKDILKCSLFDRTEFFYMKDVLEATLKLPAHKNRSSEDLIEFTLENQAEPFFSLNFSSSFNTEVRLISNRFLSITFPYHVKTVCFRDLYLAKNSVKSSCPNTFYQYDQLYIPQEDDNHFYLAKGRTITCYKFCLKSCKKTKIETIWNFDAYASKKIHPLYDLSSCEKSNRMFAQKVSKLSEGKDFKFLTMGGFEHYILAACHFLISPRKGLYQYKDFVFLLDIRTGKTLALSSLPGSTHTRRSMESLRNLTDNRLYNQDLHLIRRGAAHKVKGKLLTFYTESEHRKDYWESEEGEAELSLLSQFRTFDRLRDL